MYDFSKLIKKTRELKSLTQKEFAELIGIHPVTLSKAEDSTSNTDVKDGALAVLENLNRLKPDTLKIHKRLNGMERENLNLDLLADPDILMHHGVKGISITTVDGPLAAENKEEYKKTKKKDPKVQAVYLTEIEQNIIKMYRDNQFARAAILLLEMANNDKP